MVDIYATQNFASSNSDTVKKPQSANDAQPLEPELIKEAREALKTDYELNGDKYSSKHYADIMDKKSPLTCWRYLLHCRSSVGDAVELMKSALVWRKENQADESLSSKLVKEFWFHAPMMFSGESKKGEDVLYIIGRHYRKPEAHLRPHLLMYTTNLLFDWDRKHQHDLRQFCFVFDVADTGFRNIDLEFMTWLVSVRDYLPARISQIYIVGTPVILRPVIRLIVSWLPEKFSKLVQCGSHEQLVEQNIDKDQIPREVGGLADESYRLGPVDAPWQADMPLFLEPSMQRAIQDSLWFHTDDARTSRLVRQQINYEKRIKNNN